MEADQIKNLRHWVTRHPLLKTLLTISEEMGAAIFLVGGLIRDRLMARETQDVDLTLSREALKTARAFAERTAGTFVLLREEGEMARVVVKDQIFDFSIFRGPDLEADLKGRDFTVNAISFSLGSAFVPGEWIPYDPLQGIRDLEHRILRMASPDCFEQDPLRMLRAFRLAAQIGLTIDDPSRQAIKKRASNLTRCASERIRNEWFLLLSQPASVAAIREMDESGLLEVLFPELTSLKGIHQDRYHHLDVFDHSLLTFQHLELLIERPIPLAADLEEEIIAFLKPDRKAAWLKAAALFHDLGKARTGEVKNGYRTFYGHAEASLKRFQAIADRYRLSNREKEFIGRLIGGHMRPLFLVQEAGKGTLTRRALTRFVREEAEALTAFFLLALADSLGAQGREKPPDMENRLMGLWRKALLVRKVWIQPLEKKPPLLSGRDLIALGLEPGPLFKTLLSEIKEEQQEGGISTREQAFQRIRERCGLE